jgi:BirA family biotin operon repressor/biotin-[acetyl-CoA-carboxylase] ligase
MDSPGSAESVGGGRTADGPHHLGRAVRHFPSLDSTNTFAVSLSADPANHGLVVTADAQTAGRGQYERAWQCPPGRGVLMSVLLFPPPELRRPAVLTAWAAVAVCDTVRQAAGLDPVIKWPNDVLVGGKKVCGILCEAGARHVVAGIGLNVNQTADDFAKMGLPDATSLSTLSGTTFDVCGVSRALLARLDEWYDRLTRGGVAALEDEWRWATGLLGEPVAAERMDGTELRGRLRELGFGGVVLDQSGELTIIPPEALRHLRPIGDVTPRG